MATTVTLKPNAIDISGATSGTTTLQATAVAGTTTLTLPAATDTLVGKATTDTLTNKTLTGAVMNGTLGATTPSTVAATSISYTTTLTGGTGIIAIGTNQIYKDASGNVGIGTSSPSTFNGNNCKLAVNGGLVGLANTNAVSQYIWLASHFSGVASGLYTDSDAFPMLGTTTTHPYKFMTSATERMRISGTGDVLVTSAAGLGYGTGSGGTVTQATSKSTTVTLNKPTGQITMNNAALAAATAVEFSVNNSLITTSDCINLSGVWGASPNYRIELYGVFVGGFAVRVTNITAGSLSEALVLNFALIKGATS